MKDKIGEGKTRWGKERQDGGRKDKMDEGKTRWGRKKTRWGTREDRMADNVRQNSEKERHREDWEMKNRTGSGSATQFFYNLDASKLTGFAKRVIMFNFLSRFIRLAM